MGQECASEQTHLFAPPKQFIHRASIGVASAGQHVQDEGLPIENPLLGVVIDGLHRRGDKHQSTLEHVFIDWLIGGFGFDQTKQRIGAGQRITLILREPAPAAVGMLFALQTGNGILQRGVKVGAQFRLIQAELLERPERDHIRQELRDGLLDALIRIVFQVVQAVKRRGCQ